MSYLFKAIFGKKVTDRIYDPAGIDKRPKRGTVTEYVQAGGPSAQRGGVAEDPYKRGYSSGLSGISRLTG